MSATGGSVESITIDGREFPMTSDAEVSRKLGGFENELQHNGDGTSRQVKTRVGWSLAGCVVEVDDTRGDHEFLQEINDNKRFVPTLITYASGVSYQGLGQLVGEFQASSKSATAAFDMGGPQKLVKQ